jgi:hypothetical protein
VVLAALLAPNDAGAATVSGTVLETGNNGLGNQWLGCDGSTANVKLVRDAVQTLTTTCDPVTGAYSFAGVNLAGAAGSVVAVYLTTGGVEEGISYTRSITTANITGLLVSDDRVRLRTESVAAGPLTTAHINTWDNSNDAVIPVVSDGTVLTTGAAQRYVLTVESGSTFQPNGTVTTDKVRISGTWTAGATTLILNGTGDTGCGNAQPVLTMNTYCLMSGGAFNAGTGTVRFTLLNDGNHTDVDSDPASPITLNTLQVWPAVGGESICINNSGTLTAAAVDLGAGGLAVDVGVQASTIVTGNVTINDAATLTGSGILEGHGNVTSTLTGGVDDWNLGIRMRPAGGTAIFGSTSGANPWQFDHLYAETSAGAAVVRAAAGGTGGLIPDLITVGEPTDAATTTLDLNTNDRYMRADGGDIWVTTRGQLEMSNVQPLDGVGDIVVENLLNSNGGALSVDWALQVTAGATMNMAASVVKVGWDVDISGTYTVVGAGQLTIDGDFWKSGTFNAGSGTVTFGDAASAVTSPKPSWVTYSTPTTFFNLRNITPNKVVRLSSFQQTTVTNQLTLTGTSCSARASLAAEIDGDDAKIAAALVSANFADIGDSNQTSGNRTVTNGWNHGGNTNWTFTTPCTGFTVSGTALQTEGGAAWSKCDGVTKNVTVSVNGFATVSAACAIGTGAWTLTTSVEPNEALLAFLDADDVANRGMTITRAPSPAANVGGITVVLGQARIRSETGSALTNTELLKYDASVDSDVPVDVDQNDQEAWFHQDIEVVVEAGDTYAPTSGAQMTAVDISGSIGNATYFSIEGTGTNTSCTAAINTSIPVCIRAGGSTNLSGPDAFWYEGNGALWVAAGTYDDLHLDPPASQTYTLGTSATANNFVADNVFVHANAIATTSAFNPNLTISDDLDNDGRFQGSGTGTVTIEDNLEGSGAVDLTAGLILMQADTGSDPELCDDAGQTIDAWNFTVANLDAVPQTLLTNGNCPLHVRNDLTVGRVADAQPSTFDINLGDPLVDVDGDVIITSKGAISASNSAVMTIGSDFTNNGTFTANGGTVDFDTAGTTSSISHTTSVSFANLRVQVQPKQLNFPAGRTTSITNTFTVTGTSCIAPVDIRSSTPGTQYTLSIGTPTFQYVTVRDAIASPTETVPFTGDLGNNTGWTFSGGCTPGPNAMFTDDIDATLGATNNAAIGSDAFHMSWTNASAMAFDQQQARVVTTPPTNVLGLWQFDTATGQAADTSGNGRTLTLAGTPTSPASQTGFSEALGLNGTTQSATITDAALNLTTDFTVEAWVKVPSPATNQTIIDRSSGANINYRIELLGGNLLAEATRSGGATAVVPANGVALLGDGLWHHLALTVDTGNTLRLYVDGVQPASPAAIGGAVWSSAAAVAVGRTTAGAFLFTGQIDDVRISNVARTGPEILGYAKLRDAHNKVLWTSGVQAVTCPSTTRCADITYAGPTLHRPGARYYAQARGRLQPWAVFSAWGTYDWFETSAQLTVAIPGGNVALGTLAPNSNGSSNLDVQVTSSVTFGYKLYVSDTSDTVGMSGTGTMPDWTGPWNSPTSWPAATYGYFGLTLLAAPGGKDTAAWGTGTLANDYANLKYVGVRNTTPTMVWERTSAFVGTDTVSLGVRAAPNTSITSGAYSTTLTITAIANP